MRPSVLLDFEEVLGQHLRSQSRAASGKQVIIFRKNGSILLAFALLAACGRPVQSQPQTLEAHRPVDTFSGKRNYSLPVRRFPDKPRTPEAGSRVSPLETRAQGDLNDRRLKQLEKRLMAILDKSPNDPGALSGMGWVRSQQGNFLGAISFLEHAKLKRPNDRSLSGALELDRFRFFMSEARLSLVSGNPTSAEKLYLSALQIRPDSSEAYTRLQQARLTEGRSPPNRVVEVAPAQAATVRESSKPIEQNSLEQLRLARPQ